MWSFLLTAVSGSFDIDLGHVQRRSTQQHPCYVHLLQVCPSYAMTIAAEVVKRFMSILVCYGTAAPSVCVSCQSIHAVACVADRRQLGVWALREAAAPSVSAPASPRPGHHARILLGVPLLW